MEELENEISTQAEENTVSLASAQALADALAKIEAYTPTTWVDNSSPDIDAEHLNKPEQAIKRVTDALNSAVDVIKDLQSQITKNSGAISDVNNNLSNTNSRLDTPLYSSVLDYALTLSEGLYAVRFPGAGYTGTDLPDSSYMYSSATISVRSTGKIATVLLFGISKNCPLAVNSCEDGKWKGWDQYVTKDDLGVAQYNAVGQISLSGKLSNIGEWLKNNGTPGKCTFVRVEPSDSDGYFGTSGFSILWMRTSVNYGWCILISDNPKMVVFGRNSAGWHWYAPSLTEVS